MRFQEDRPQDTGHSNTEAITIVMAGKGSLTIRRNQLPGEVWTLLGECCDKISNVESYSEEKERIGRISRGKGQDKD